MTMAMVKWIHVGFALLSVCGFFARGILMMRGSPWLQARPVRIIPHVVDTVLLTAAVVLATQWGWSALQLPWLQAKIAALLVYIALGMVALHGVRPLSVRVVAWLAALAVFGYIVAVAVTRDPLPVP